MDSTAEITNRIVDVGGRRIPVTYRLISGYHARCSAPVEPPFYSQYLYLHLRHSRLLYVGISNNWQARQRQHARSSPWFPAVDEIAVDEWCNRESVAICEESIIRRLKPIFNRDRLDGTFMSAKQFSGRLATVYQHLDDPNEWTVRKSDSSEISPEHIARA